MLYFTTAVKCTSSPCAYPSDEKIKKTSKPCQTTETALEMQPITTRFGNGDLTKVYFTYYPHF